MKNYIQIWPEELVEKDGFITSSVAIEYPDRTRAYLWYRIPEQHQSFLTQSCDPFVLATLMMAMNKGTNLVVNGQVSPSLLRNLEEFQAAWSAWRSTEYHPIEIQAKTETESSISDSTDRVVAAFSGGVDSCFSVFRHRRKVCGRLQRNLEAGLMVHGFDIPITDPAFDLAAEKSQVMLASLGMELIPMGTNFREVIKLPWEDVFGTAIASCLHLIKNRYTAGLIASSYAYRYITFPYGSNPLTDIFLSSKTFEIVHDGASAIRLEKIQAILDWPEALQNLRVCWQGEQKDRNCGRCEKCVRNILNFRALGAKLPPCFETDVTNEQILKLKARGSALDALEAMLGAIEANNISGDWVDAIKKSVRKNRMMGNLEAQIPNTWKKRLQKIKSDFKITR